MASRFRAVVISFCRTAHANVIFGTTAAITLTNVDNTISGAGQIGVGDNTLTLVNEATIVADRHQCSDYRYRIKRRDQLRNARGDRERRSDRE